jgi:hypothetical protein
MSRISVQKENNRLKKWNEEVRDAIQAKKTAYNKYLCTRRLEDHTLYKKARAKARLQCRKMNHESWEAFVKRTEHDVTGAQQMRFKIFKKLASKENDNARINLILEEEWTKHYKYLLYKHDIDLTNTMSQQDEQAISYEELEQAIKNSKNRKSAGPDNIPMELWQNFGKNMKKLLLRFFNNLWKQGTVPKEWETALMINIYKKGDWKICNNYRGISLLNTASKIYAQILKMKLNTIAKGFLNENLNLFRKGRSCTDAIFSLEQILEKRREFNLPTYVLFLDYEKAYDSVDRSKLWSILESYEVQQNLINAIKSLYKNTEICIKISDTKISKPVIVNVGLRQGCGLSPVLFNIYINKIIDLWKMTNPKGIKIMRDTQITHLMYADEQVLLAPTEDDL